MTTLLSTANKQTQHYQTNQQVKYLHLVAEVDMLLQRVNALRQRQAKEITPQTLSTSNQ